MLNKIKPKIVSQNERSSKPALKLFWRNEFMLLEKHTAENNVLLAKNTRFTGRLKNKVKSIPLKPKLLTTATIDKNISALWKDIKTKDKKPEYTFKHNEKITSSNKMFFKISFIVSLL